MSLPQAIRPFVDFPALLRANGFSVSPDQTIGFIEAVGLLGPRSIGDVYRAARALLAIPKAREAEFDALFRAFFFGQSVAAPLDGAEGEDVEAHEASGAETDVELDKAEEEPGQEATASERLSRRDFSELELAEALRAFERAAPGALPRRRSYRWAVARRGRRLDMRRTLRDAARRDGEVMDLVRSRRKTRQRRIVLLVDVSGSMTARTDQTLRFAHVLVQAADRVEVFTLGTRLTRITPALRIARLDRALARVGGLVADFDGGTRIGTALGAYLSVPRYAGFARGAAVTVLSDGLERGGPEAMVASVQRLSRLAWRLDWLSPLAGEAGFVPRTEALQAILPYLDSLGDGGSLPTLTTHMLSLGRAA